MLPKVLTLEEIEEEESRSLGVITVEGWGHTQETYWKLHGEPTSWKKKSGSKNKLGGDFHAFQVSNLNPG